MINYWHLGIFAFFAFLALVALCMAPDVIAISRGARSQFEDTFGGGELEALFVIFTFPHRLNKALTDPVKHEERGWAAVSKALKPRKRGQ